MSKEEDGYVKTPTFLEMVTNFKRDMHKFIKSGAVVTTPEEYSSRLGECNSCDKLIRERMRCGQCGCLLEGKAKMKSSYCPLGKWENGIEQLNNEG